MAAAIDRAAWAALVRRLMAAESNGNQSQFADTIKVDRRTVRRWLNQEVAVSEENVAKVARALGELPRDLLVQVGYYQPDELPGETTAAERVAQDDEAMRLIRQSDVPLSVKRDLLKHMREKRARDEAARVAEAEQMLRIARRATG